MSLDEHLAVHGPPAGARRHAGRVPRIGRIERAGLAAVAAGLFASQSCGLS